MATLAEQVSPAPSLTVTLPVGVPLPGEFAVTVKVMLTACPTTDGLGVCAVIDVVAETWLTVWDNAGEEVLVVKFVSPA